MSQIEKAIKLWLRTVVTDPHKSIFLPKQLEVLLRSKGALSKEALYQCSRIFLLTVDAIEEYRLESKHSDSVAQTIKKIHKRLAACSAIFASCQREDFRSTSQLPLLLPPDPHRPVSLQSASEMTFQVQPTLFIPNLTPVLSTFDEFSSPNLPLFHQPQHFDSSVFKDISMSSQLVSSNPTDLSLPLSSVIIPQKSHLLLNLAGRLFSVFQIFKYDK